MRTVRIDDFATYRYVNSVRVTKDAAHLVYSVIVPNMGENRYDNDLWTMDVATGEQRRLTSSGKEGTFEFMDDGSVLFVSRRGKDALAKASGAKPGAGSEGSPERGIAAKVADKASAELAEDPARGTDLYRIALDGGEATLYAHVPLAVADWKQLPEGRLLVRARELSDAAAPYVSIEDIPFWENGDTYTAGLRWGLYVVEPPAAGDACGCAAAGCTAGKPAPAQVRRLTAEGESVDCYALSADRTRVYLVSSTYHGEMPLVNRASFIDVATGEAVPFGPEDMAFRYIGLLEGDSAAATAAGSGETVVLVGTDMRRFGLNEDPHVFVADADGSNYRRISRDDFDTDFYNHIVTDARQGGGQCIATVGGHLVYAHADNDASVLSCMDATGAVTRLVDGAGSVDSFDTLDGRTFYYVAMRPNRLPELYRACVDAAGAVVEPETCLTDFSRVLEDVAVTEPEQFTFESNGATLTGYVIKPAGYEPGRKYPGVLWVHGGPKCTLGNLFIHEQQYLSGLGYFVFYTNPHGSGSHGIEYAASIFGGYGGKDFEDLMTFTDEVLERYPDVDPDRLAEMGGSYGGFMTNWVIGHTDRFRCCNSQRSISNWVSMFGVADIGYYFAGDQTHGWPWGAAADGTPNVAAMWDQSPLKYADRVTTPTLFLHSDCDYRCPLEQGMQMFTALQLHGVPSKLVVFKGENHELSRSGKPQARVRRLVEIADWYARWLKDEPAGEPSLHGGEAGAGAEE